MTRPAEPLRARPHLLVVEDNAVNQKVASAMLAKLGYAADVVADGAEAVEAVSRTAYAAVLMDCQMPQMDGYQATVEIRRREQGGIRVPIIAMTASAMRGEREKCLSVGMDDYIAKPIFIEELAAVLTRWLGQAAKVGDAGGGASERPSDPRPVLDPEVVEQLRALGEEGEPDGFTQLAEVFVEDSSFRLQSLRQAIRDRDLEALKSHVHALKGVTGTVGAARLADRCSEFEELIVARGRDLDPSALDPLEEEFQRVLEAVSATFPKTDPRPELPNS